MMNGGGRNARVRIRAFPGALDQNVVDNLWRNVNMAIIQILEKNNSGLSFEELYRNAYNLVLQRQGERLYNGFRGILQEHLIRNVRATVVDALESDNFLNVLMNAWNDHQTAMVMIRDILMYMDRVYVTQNQLSSIFNLGLTYFRDQLVRHDIIREKMRNTILEMIGTERRGELINCSIVRQVTKMLMILGIDNRSVYEQDFEADFIKASREFYQQESQQFLANNSAYAYVTKVEERIEEEIARSRRYLDASTEQNIVRVVEEELISKHLLSIVNMENSGVVFLLQANKKDELKRMYKLFSRVDNGLRTIFKCISDHLRAEGRSLVEDFVEKDKAISFVNGLLALLTKYQEFLVESFENDSVFSNFIDNDFIYIINLKSKAPEFLSLFIDEKLRSNKPQEKELSEQENESILTRAMILFKYLNDKDMFEKYYKNHTARRLLNVRSCSFDLEKFMISQLRRECGAELTNKLEGMFKDIHTAADVQSQFDQFLHKNNIRLEVSLNVRVLTVTHWTSLNQPTCNLPDCVAQSFDEFIKFYRGKHNNRKLTIWHNAGTIDVTAYFYPKSARSTNAGVSSSAVAGSSKAPAHVREQYFFSMSTFQMAVLMLFNQRDTWSFEEIRQETAIPEGDLMRYIAPLISMRKSKPILLDKSGSPTITKDSIFEVNDSFSSKLRKVKIQSQISKVENDVERKETKAKVEDDRRNTIDAAIVRIMKARKTMLLQKLVGEVIEQLKSRFKPDPPLIKKRIETLVEREYLQTKDSKTYEYLS